MTVTWMLLSVQVDWYMQAVAFFVWLRDRHATAVCPAAFVVVMKRLLQLTKVQLYKLLGLWPPTGF
jgi:hypothetical protein